MVVAWFTLKTILCEKYKKYRIRLTCAIDCSTLKPLIKGKQTFILVRTLFYIVNFEKNE